MAHRHHHHDSATGDRRLLWAVAVNLGLTVVQVVGGLISGSLALIADALHNFSDAATLIIAVLARRIARRPADASMTFGYGRAEIVAALVNFTTLILIGLYLIVEAVSRLMHPVPIEGWTVIIVATVALAIDLITVLMTLALARESMNIRAAFLHNVADALGSLAVIIGGIVVVLYDWTLIDPLLTLAIAAYVLWHGASEIGHAIRILMNAAPAEMDTHDVARAMSEIEGVANVHHVHLWRFDEKRVSLEAHVVIADAEPDHVAVKRRLRAMLAERFEVGHVTLETERDGEHCGGPSGIGAVDGAAS